MADHLVDLWDVTVGSIDEWSLDSGPSRFFAEGWQLDSTARVREATTKPIVGVSRLTDPDLMAEIVRSGVWDLIGAARPSIADPFLPRKIDEGRVDEIRECIGCNICISKADTPPPHRLHAERDRGRGAPARLAPRALRAAARRLRRARRRWRAGRHGVRADARPARSGARAPRRPLAGDGRAPRLAHAAAGPCRVGAPDGLSHGGAQAPAERRADQRDRADRGGDRAQRGRCGRAGDGLARGARTASTASRALRSRAPTRARPTCSRPSR